MNCQNGGVCAKGAKDLSDLEDSAVAHVAHLDQTYDEQYFEHCVCKEGWVRILVGEDCELTYSLILLLTLSLAFSLVWSANIKLKSVVPMSTCACTVRSVSRTTNSMVVTVLKRTKHLGLITLPCLPEIHASIQPPIFAHTETTYQDVLCSFAPTKVDATITCLPRTQIQDAHAHQNGLDHTAR